MDFINKLSERATSSFPISIGTALSLESIFNPLEPAYDPNREIPNKVSIMSYDYFFINVATLIRNILGAVDKTNYLMSTPSSILEVLESEIEVINSLLNNEGLGKVKPMYYYNTYKEIENEASRNTFINIRKDNTDKQKLHTSKVDNTITLLEKSHKNFLYQDR